MKAASAYKPGYDGAQPETRTTPIEDKLMSDRAGEVRALVRRLHAAILTAADVGHGGFIAPPQAAGPISDYMHDFGDLVGQEKEAPVAPKFQPSASNITDMTAALQLVEGLSRPFLKVLFLKALWEFHDLNEFDCGWSLAKVGARAGGFSDEWARQTYEAVIVQAARRAGLLPFSPKDYAIIAASVKTGAWRSYLATSLDPLQQVYDLKGKSPVALDQAFAIWVPGKPVAKRAADAVKKLLRPRLTHSSWFYVSPEELAALLLAELRTINSPWEFRELSVGTKRI